MYPSGLPSATFNSDSSDSNACALAELKGELQKARQGIKDGEKELQRQAEKYEVLKSSKEDVEDQVAELQKAKREAQLAWSEQRSALEKRAWVSTELAFRDCCSVCTHT